MARRAGTLRELANAPSHTTVSNRPRQFKLPAPSCCSPTHKQAGVSESVWHDTARDGQSKKFSAHHSPGFCGPVRHCCCSVYKPPTELCSIDAPTRGCLSLAGSCTQSCEPSCCCCVTVRAAGDDCAQRECPVYEGRTCKCL